jgi:two-component system, chemotaxis family, chemotaxis protein CheY
MSKILIVDDSPAILFEMSEVLQTLGHKVIQACDGYEAMEALEKIGTLDILITDLNMPNLDGMGLAKRISQSRFAGQFPIVMVSTEFSSDLKIEGKKNGIKLWMVKPIQKKEFGEIINKILLNAQAPISQYIP